MQIVEAKKGHWKFETELSNIHLRYSADADTWRVTVDDGERIKMQAHRRTFQEALMRAWDWYNKGE